MNDADKAALKARIDEALAASMKESGTLPTPKGAPLNVHMPMDGVWALVTLEDVRFLLTDRAVRTLGGHAFAVTVDDAGGRSRPGRGQARCPSRLCHQNRRRPRQG